MKITICGKGGCGKSTISTLLAQAYAAAGKRVLVIDGDESNYGLHQMLGKEQPKEYIEEMGGKQQVMGAMMKNPGNMPNFFDAPWTMDTLPAGYSPAAGEIKLMNVGKIHNANEGCACPFNTLLTQLVSNLQLAENDVAILDMEAGIEHFGRGIDSTVDACVMVVDPTAESLKLAAKVHGLCNDMGKPVVYAFNKLEEGDEEVMRKAIDDPALIGCTIAADRALRQAGLTGEALELDQATIEPLVRALEKTLGR